MAHEPPLLTHSQIALLRFRYLTEETATVKSLAEETGLPRYRVASLLKGADFDSFRDGLHASMAQQAQTILARSAEQAAQQWVRAMGPAADKGDHRPMRDLLTAVHAIDPEASAPTLVVQIGVTSNDVQILTYQPKPATLPAHDPNLVIEALPEASKTGHDPE